MTNRDNIGVDEQMFHWFHRMAATGLRISRARLYFLEEGKMLSTETLGRIVDSHPYEQFIKRKKW